MECTDFVLFCESQSTEYYVYLCVYTPIVLIGMLFNGCNIFVLANSTFKGCGPTFTFLTAMAVADLLCLIISCPFGMTQCILSEDNFQSFSTHMYEIYIFMPMANTFATASVWITMTVAIERYISVNHISLAGKICTKKYARVALVIIFILSFILHIPFFLFYKVEDGDTILYTEFAYSKEAEVYDWIRTFLAKYIPIVILVIFNLLLLYCVYQATKKRQNMGVVSKEAAQHRQQQQNKCTAMLLGITVTFTICHIFEPFVHPVVYQGLFGYCSIFTSTYRNLTLTINILEVTSYASNFVFYCVFNQEFAKSVKSLLRCKLHKRGSVEPNGINHM